MVHIPPTDAARTISRMDIKTTRRNNLRLLIGEVGSVKALAEKADTDPNHLSAMASDNPSVTPKGTIRGIGYDLARKLENACGKATGWMDQPHNIRDDQMMLLELFSQLTPELQDQAIAILGALAQTVQVVKPPAKPKAEEKHSKH